MINCKGSTVRSCVKSQTFINIETTSVLVLTNNKISRGLYIGKYPPPWGGGVKISDDDIWGEKYEKAKRKRGKM
jgi:hypothetical protein